jgi:hypothetical protein
MEITKERYLEGPSPMPSDTQNLAIAVIVGAFRVA